MDLTAPQTHYALEFISGVAGRPVTEAPAALLKKVFYALSLSEELQGPRDTWGNWDWQYSAANREGKLYRPWLDEAVREWLVSTGTAPMPRWPGGRPFAVCLTHDVDVVTARPSPGEWRSRTREVAKREGAGPFERFIPLRRPWLRRYRFPGQTDVLWHYDRWVKEEQRHGFHSTFLMFPAVHGRRHQWDCTYRMSDEVMWDGRRMTVAGMCRELASSGWDTGLHGSYYSYDDAGVLAEQKRQIEEASGRPVTSTRQHYLHFEASRTPAAQASAGLRADSTVGFNRNIGFRAGTSFPFRLWDTAAQAALPILEIPMTMMDVAVFDSGALEYQTEEQVAAHAVELMERVAAVHGCLTLNWHPNYFTQPLWWNSYCRILEEAARRGAWGCSMEELRAWRAGLTEAGV